jgi:hypothetical protein
MKTPSISEHSILKMELEALQHKPSEMVQLEELGT